MNPSLVAAASDLPRRPVGTRARSGNAMQRTRSALIDAAAHCVERYGVRRTTMGDVALKAAVAKATLYNHFRTKDDLLAALVESRAAALASVCEAVAAGRPPAATGTGDIGSHDLGAGLAAALRCAAAGLAADRPLRRTVADEPALASRLATPGDGRGWEAVRGHVARMLEAADAPADRAAVDVVLRWLVSQVLWPAGADEVALAAGLLERGLHARAAT